MCRLGAGYVSAGDYNCPSRSRRSSGSDNLWPGYPYLYRILGNGYNNVGRYIDEGNGIQGLKSRSLFYNQERPAISLRVLVPVHVAANPEHTPWISTSAGDLSMHDSAIRNEIQRRLQYSPTVKDIYLVTIDARYLDPSRNRIVNLMDEKTRNSLLSSSPRAINYARDWNLLLIYWDVPSRAIVKSRRYYFNRNTGQIKYTEESNPNYDASSLQNDIRFEDFADEDDIDRSAYPNY